MYNIDAFNNTILFSYQVGDLFEEIKRITALKAQQLVTKEGTDMSDMFVVTDDQKEQMSSWLSTVLPYITSSVPQQHITTGKNSEVVTVSVSSDLSRAISEGNILSADGVLMNYLVNGCVAEWYSSVAQAEFAQEYSTKMSENIKLFAEILFDSRKFRTRTMFAPLIKETDQTKSFQEIINNLATSIADIIRRVSKNETDIRDGNNRIDSNSNNITSLSQGLQEEVERALSAESGLLEMINNHLAHELFKLIIKVNGTTIATYNPKTGETTADIITPTRVEDLDDATNYMTREQISSAIQEAIGTIDISSILQDYATREWVIDYIAEHLPSPIVQGFVDLISAQNISGEKTFSKANFTESLSIPTIAPTEPLASKVYLYFAEEGTFLESS